MNIALFLSSDGIALAHRQAAGHWAMIGETALDVPDLGSALAALKAEAANREGDDFKTLLVLPDDQILYTSLTAPTAEPELTAFRIEDGLDGLTPYAVTELMYDWHVLEEDRVKIAVVARETLEEARGFASTYGFDTAGFAAMPPMERFAGVPTFDLGADAAEMGFSADGIAFGPDMYGQPEPDPEPEPVAEDTAEPVEDAEPAAEPEADLPEPKAEPEPEPVTAEPVPDAAEGGPEQGTAAPTDPLVAPAPVPDSVTPDAPLDEPATDTPPLAEENPALAEALDIQATELEGGALDPTTPVAAIEDPAASDPAPSISDEVIGDAGPDDDELPPAPSPASREARQRARVIRSGADTQPPAAAGEPQFTARRGRASAPDNDKGSLVGSRDSRLGLSGATETTPPAPASGAPAASPSVASMPRLAEQLKRVRAASETRPAGAPVPRPAAAGPIAQPPRPRVEIPPRDLDGPASGLSAEPRGPSPFDGKPEADASQGRGLGGLFGRRGTGDNSETADPAKGREKPRRKVRRKKADAAPVETAEAAPTDAAPAEGTDNVPESGFSSGLLARKAADPTGPSFRTGLILTLILLILLAIVAIWSALFLPNSPVARLFGMSPTEISEDADPSAPDVAAEAPVFGTTDGTDPSLADEAAADGIDLALDGDGGGVDAGQTGDAPGVQEVAASVPAAGDGTELPDIDAELDLPPLPPMPQDLLPSIEEAQEIYAQDGIWARTPERPDLQPFDLLDRVYTASIDPQIQGLDAVALPDPGVNPGELLRRFPPPPAYGTEYDLTASGMVAPTPEGVLTPEGAFVVAATPPVASVPRPREIVVDAPEINTDSAILAAYRPTQRPADLDEIRERQVLGGLTEDELGARRPAERPLSPQEAAAQASLFPDGTDPDAPGDGPLVVENTGTALATARSLVPTTRPANIAQIVASADRTPLEQPTAVVAAAVAAAPSIPSNADVSRAATERNAIRLRNVNLIGVTGTPSDRRALVRLASGRFVRVGVGDRLDGGRVAAIGETTLQYVRNGRTVTLEIPG